jgi:hypothetical protein
MTGRVRTRAGVERRSAAARGDASRIAELKAKLGDEEYMSGAILRIATVLSARIVEGYLDERRTAR